MIYEARLKEINTYYLAKGQPEDMIRIYKYWEDVNMGHTEDFYVGYKIGLGGIEQNKM